jgi:phasin family protein
MDFATDNAERACTFAGKVCNAKTSEEILTLQTRFAQDLMQTFVKNTQELYDLIGETPQR